MNFLKKSLLLLFGLAVLSCGKSEPENYFFFNDYCWNYDYKTLNE